MKLLQSNEKVYYYLLFNRTCVLIHCNIIYEFEIKTCVCIRFIFIIKSTTVIFRILLILLIGVLTKLNNDVYINLNQHSVRFHFSLKVQKTLITTGCLKLKLLLGLHKGL